MEKRNVTRFRGEHTQRERVWLAIRELTERASVFTRDDLRDAADAHDTTIEKSIQLLRQNGVVQTVGTLEEDARKKVYEQVERVEGFPPCISTRVLPWREQVWNALRIQGMTTVPAIKTTFHEVDPADDTVYRYLRVLEDAGYVRRAGRSGPVGQVMSHLRWRLVNDIGPKAPTQKQLEQEISRASRDSSSDDESRQEG